MKPVIRQPLQNSIFRTMTLQKALAHKKILMLICILYTFMFTFISCSQDKVGERSDNKDSDGIHEKVEKGPATLILDIDKKEISIADRIHLSITIEIDENYNVTLPSFGEKLEQFGIVDYHTSQPELTAEKRKKIIRSYLLEPFLSGEYIIPPMEVGFQKEGEEAVHKIDTPKAVIKVNSLLPEDIKDMKINEIIPPLPFPRSYKFLFWGTGIALTIIVLSTFMIFIFKRRKRQEAESIRIKAHELAYNEIRLLVEEGLIDKGEIKLFYQRISGILRRYIENRFGLRAPEQTTEEFLSGLEAAIDFPEEYKPLLNTFLRHCDLVKFAKHEPMKEDIQKTFDSCKAFIQGTEEKE